MKTMFVDHVNCRVLVKTKGHLFLLIKQIFIISLLSPFAVVLSVQSEDTEKKLTHEKITTETVFKAAFVETRIQQIEVIKSVLRFQDYEKQYKITIKAMEKIYEVVVSSRAIVENSNYIPGSALPSNVTVLEALGQIIDNTAMFGEFRLKLPDITEIILKHHQDWFVLMKWAIGFSNSTGVFDEKSLKMINLLCQEMKLIPREENYVNPYRKYETKVRKGTTTVAPKQKKQKIKKGPRMTKMRNAEL